MYLDMDMLDYTLMFVQRLLLGGDKCFEEHNKIHNLFPCIRINFEITIHPPD
jgi:hypothetical protein